MGPSAWALLLLVVALALALGGIATLLSGSARRAELAARGAGGGEGPGSRAALAAVDARLRRTRSGQRLQAWLRGAGVTMSPGEFLGLAAAGTLLAWILLRLLVPGGIALVAALGLVVAAARGWIGRQRARRQDALITQLPELARLLSNGTSAGLSLAGAIQLAARELPDPAGGEMRLVVEELRVGRAIEDSLASLRERLPSREVAVLMTTLIIQQRAGGDTVRALSELAATLDARKDLLREVRTLMAGSVYTSYIVAGIGVATILLINTISPGVMRQMTTTAIGLAGLTVCAVLWTIAFILIRRTTRVEL